MQKIIYQSDGHIAESTIQTLMNQGWTLKQVIPQSVACNNIPTSELKITTDSNKYVSNPGGYPIYGGFIFILEMSDDLPTPTIIHS